MRDAAASGGAPRLLGAVDVDQWTIQTARRQQPVQHFALQDAAGTELYLNGATGEVFQETNRRERVLSWMGAIPHWLYPTFLRRNGPLWSKIVIWTSVAGCFLAATGLYVGISRLRRRAPMAGCRRHSRAGGTGTTWQACASACWC